MLFQIVTGSLACNIGDQDSFIEDRGMDRLTTSMSQETRGPHVEC